MEIWKDIQGYEGLYQVSNLGNVRSLNWGNRNLVVNLFLKPHNKGYLQVELHKNGKRKMFTVHRLVALHFVKGYSDNKVVNHINEIKTDNRSENLEWVSQSYNTRYSLRNERKYGENHGRIKGKATKCTTPILQLTTEGLVIRFWESAIDVKNSIGYSDWSIKECCKGKRKQAYGYKWQFAI